MYVPMNRLLAARNSFILKSSITLGNKNNFFSLRIPTRYCRATEPTAKGITVLERTKSENIRALPHPKHHSSGQVKDNLSNLIYYFGSFDFSLDLVLTSLFVITIWPAIRLNLM